MIKMSIIVPVYNVEMYLAKCLDSICSQLNEDIELICVNDSSTDDSIKILEEYQKKYNFMVINNEHNLGLAESRNVGFGYAGGKYIWFIDSDDFLEDNVINKCIETLEKNELDVLAFDAVQVLGNNNTEKICTRRRKYKYTGVFDGKGMLLEQLGHGEYLATAWQAAYRREFLMENNIKFISGIFHEDEWFTFQVYMKARRAMTINDVMYVYRKREGSITAGGDIDKRFEGLLITYSNIIRYLKMIPDDTSAGIGYIFNFERSIRRLYNAEVAGKEEYTSFMSRQSEINQYLLSWILFPEDKNKIIIKERHESKRIPERLINRMKETNHIYMYGAGLVANKMMKELEENDIGISGVVVTKLDAKKNFWGHPVSEFEQIKKELAKGVVLLAVSKKLCIQIAGLLKENGIKYINVYEEDACNE